MKSIEKAKIIEGTIVMVRVDWNVPLSGGMITDVSRIRASKKTIEYALQKGARVIVISHFGDNSDSIEPVVNAAKAVFDGVEIKFVRDPWNTTSSDGEKMVRGLKSGEIAVFENLRLWMEKENDEHFAEQLASFADIYINEAFSTSHRAHTSIVALPKLLPHYAGFHFLEEYEKLSEVFEPEHPFLFILGGAKFETKLPLVQKFLDKADHIFIGGAMVKHAREMGCGENPKVLFPVGDDVALDANDQTIEMLRQKIEEAKMILWNGPLGNYENGYKEGTLSLAKILAGTDPTSTHGGGKKVILGGGDTVAAIKELKMEDKVYFVSLAGGAMLDFLANGTLPGIEALDTK